MTLCASFCWKSLSRPSLCNLDSTPPQIINAAANDGEPCAGGKSPTSQDFAPIHGGLPELSAPFCNQPDFTLPQKSEAAAAHKRLHFAVAAMISFPPNHRHCPIPHSLCAFSLPLPGVRNRVCILAPPHVRKKPGVCFSLRGPPPFPDP